jgi:hypothetical protein
MSNREEPWLRVVAEPGQTPARRKAGGGMSSTAQSIFDVLYEAGEPLDADAIAARTWDRSTSAAQGYALRKARDQYESNRRWYSRTVREPKTEGVRLSRTPREVWTSRIRKLLGQRRLNGTLLGDEQGRYSPNPEKPPIAERVDGSTYRYSREAWLETTQAARTTGEVHTMAMEVERYLGGRSRDELLMTLELFVDEQAGFGKDKRRPLDPRTIRKQLRWLLERPTTDESRAWLLHELIRRIYES